MDHHNPPNNGRSYYQMDPQVTGDLLSSHPTHALHNDAYPDSDYQPGIGGGRTPPAVASSSTDHVFASQDSKPYPAPPGPMHELSSDSLHHAAYPDSNYSPGGGYSPHAGPSTQLASSSIDNAAYPDSNYRPGTAYSASHSPAPPPGPPPTRALPCPKSLESTTSSAQSQWNRSGPSSAAGPSGVLMPQATGSELPPPPYQSGGNGTPPPHPQSIQPPSPSYAAGQNPYAGYNTSSTPSPTRQRREDIPMTTFPVYQNSPGHVAQSSTASSALERGYKEYDRNQAKIDETNRRRSRRKWLIGSLVTTVVIAAIIGVVVALIKNKVFDDDDDD